MTSVVCVLAAIIGWINNTSVSSNTDIFLDASTEGAENIMTNATIITVSFSYFGLRRQEHTVTIYRDFLFLGYRLEDVNQTMNDLTRAANEIS